jgi:transcriptional regulator with XRE-family HTH domain
MTVYEKLAEQCRELRKKAKISQKDLAEKIGVSPTLITKFEKNGIKLSAERLNDIFGVLGYQLDISGKKTTSTCA